MTEVGISIIADWDSLERNRELVRVADEGGLALVGIQDHPYQRRFFDTWSLIPTLMAETRRIRSSPTSQASHCAPRQSWPKPPPRSTYSAAAASSSGSAAARDPS